METDLSQGLLVYTGGPCTFWGAWKAYPGPPCQVRALIEEAAARHSGDMQTLLMHDAGRCSGCRRYGVVYA